MRVIQKDFISTGTSQEAEISNNEVNIMLGNHLPNLLLFFAKASLYFIAMVLTVSGVLFLFGGHIQRNSLIGVVSLALVATLLIWEFKKIYQLTTTKVIAYLATTILMITIISFCIGKIYDQSWDGQAYHQIGILKLSEGWNPVYEMLPHTVEMSHALQRNVTMNLWINHYGKALEIFSAVFLGLTNNVETGKVFNILLFVAAFGFLYRTLCEAGFFTKWWSLIIAFAAAFNPVTINQIYSYLQDGAQASLILIILTQFVSLLLPSRKPTSAMMVIIFAAIVLINIKFTGLVYFCWIGFTFFLVLLFLKYYQLLKSFVITCIVAIIASVGVAGFNPYITNTVNFGHPFYPLVGNSDVDIIVNNIPYDLKPYSRAGKFIRSTFSKSDNFTANENGKKTEYKVPFTFTINELKTFKSEISRLGGFGVLWSGVLCLAIIAIMLLLKQQTKTERLYLLALTLAILGSVFINPENWWARYVPQLWLFPVAIFAFAIQKKNLLRRIAMAGLILMIVNTAMVGAMYTYSVLIVNTRANKMFEELKASKKPVSVYFDMFTPNEVKLVENKIPYTRVSSPVELSCENPVELLKMKICQ